MKRSMLVKEEIKEEVVP